MSPVFGHGRLRLYLLKLLDEAPRHGYEIIRLLQDRFLGVYAPSPGTIYPRLARLEEEGLVTHEEEHGKKVYRLTDRGREEVNNRLDELADLEMEITESARDIAREVKEDVRSTVRNLREELQSASREMRTQAREQQRQQRDEWHRSKREFKRATREAKESAKRAFWEDRDWRSADWWTRDWQDWSAFWPDWTAYTDDAARVRRELQRLVRKFTRDLRQGIDMAGPADAQALEEARQLFEESAERLHTEILDAARKRFNAKRDEADPGPDTGTSGPEDA